MKFIRSALAFWLLYARRMSRTARSFFGGPAWKPYVLILGGMGLLALIVALPPPKGPQVIAYDRATGVGAAITLPSQINFKTDGAGAVTRKLSAKLSDSVSGKDCGAVGDGVTDDSLAIQNCIINHTRVVLTCNGVFPNCSYNLGSTGIVIPSSAGGANILECDGQGVKLLYTGTGTALTIGDTLGSTVFFTIRGCQFDLGSGGSGSGAIKLIRITAGNIQDVAIGGRTTAPDNGTGILLDGTGFYIGTILFSNVWVTGNYTKGIYCQGAAAINTCNFHTFINTTVARTTTKPGTGTIGFHWGVNSGDGRLVNVNVEGYDTAYQIDGRYLQGLARFENNTNGVVFGATASNNVIWPSPFGNTTDVTYTGGEFFNSYIDSTTWQQNTAKGQIYYGRNTDGPINEDIKAGNSAEQSTCRRWLNRDGTTVAWRECKSSLGAYILDDGTNTRFNMAGGANDNIDLRPTGTGEVALGFSAGSGGVGFYVGSSSRKAQVTSTGAFVQAGVAFAALGTPANGTITYCTDCTIANPCAAAGTGAFAKRLNGVWVCN